MLRCGSVSVAKLAVRGDRIVAKTTLVRQQRDMAKVAHQAIRQYLAVVRRAVAHTAVTAAAPTMTRPIAPHTSLVETPPEDESDLGDDVDLNALDQSAAWPGILRSTILPSLEDLIGGIGPADRMTPSVMASVSAWRAQYMAGRTQALVGVPDQITRQIRDAIQADADTNGTNPRSAAGIVKDLLNPDAPTWASRADTIARTEVIGANNQGGLASWTAVHQSLASAGGAVYKTWLATSDSRTRPDHADIDGTEISVDDTFTVGGQEMNGPGDDGADGDETINCRCTLTFRVDDGSGGGEEVDEATAEAMAEGGDAAALDETALDETAAEGVDAAETEVTDEASVGEDQVEASDTEPPASELSDEKQAIEDAPTGDDAFNLLNQNTPDLNSEEAGRVQYYTGDGFSQLNQRIAAGTMDEADTNAANTLDDIISRAPAADDAVVFRGVRSMDDASVGDVISNDGFVSTTASQNMAKTYAGVDPGRAMIRILVPQGQPALALDKTLSNNPVEKEVLLPKGINFRVVGKSTVKGAFGQDTPLYDVVIDQKPVVSSALVQDFTRAIRRRAADAGGDDGGDAMTAAVEAPVTAPAKAPAAAPDSSKPYEPQPYAPEPDETVTCPNCQKMNDTDAVYCDQCGFELKGATGVVVAPPAADDATPMTAAGPMPPAGPPQPADGTPSEAAPAAPPGAMKWSGVLATLDMPSSDGRMIQSAGLTIRPLPLPLSYQQHGEHGGEEAGKTVIVGRILTAAIEGGQVVGTGDFLDVMGCYEAMAALEQVAAGIGGVSIDLPVQVVSYMAPGPGGTLLPIDPMQYLGDPDTIIQVAEQSELAGACIVNTPAFAAARIELVAADTAVPNLAPVVADAASPVGPVLTDDSITFPDGTVLHVGDQVNIVDANNPAITSGLIESIDPSTNAVTVAVEDPTQPGQTNSITVDAGSLSVADPDAGEPPATGGTGTPDGVTAAAMRFPGLEEEHVYPAEWFDPVQLDGPTRMTITDEGRVYGHLAQSGTCHVGFADKCVAPPESPTNYAYFHMGEVKTDKGLIAAGKITVGGGHADIRLGWRLAQEHYDNAASVGAVVRAYRDEHGIQVAGALLPNATKEQIAAMRRSPLSGDWRIIGGERELTFAHCVNDPGFPIAPRAALAADGHPTALVAAGIVYGPPMDDEPTPGGITLPSGVKLTDADVAVLASAFADVTDQRNQEALDREQRATDARNLRRSLLRNKLRVV